MIHLLIICACVPLSAWRVYVTLILWKWFVTPAFGTSASSFFLMWGLLLTLSLLIGKPDYDKSDNPDSTAKAAQWLTFTAFVPLFALGFGWLIKTFGGL